jgi:hypothetical protein
LLRNGLDYLAFQEYARALSFFKAVEARQAELSPAELQSLKKGISQAQAGMREAVNSPRIVNQGKARAVTQPGSLALARPGAAKAPTDNVQRTSVELPSTPPSRSTPALPSPIRPGTALPDPEPVATVAVAVAAAEAPASASAPALTAPTGNVELPPLPDSATLGLPELPAAPAMTPSLPAQAPTVDPSALPAQSSLPVDLPPATPTPLPTGPPPPLVLESSAPTPVELPPVDNSTPPTPIAELPPVTTSPPTPMPVEPMPVPAVEPTPRAMVAEAGQQPDSSVPPQPVTLPEPPPAPEAAPAPAADVPSMPPYPTTSPRTIPRNEPLEPVLGEKLRREAEEKFRMDQIAQRSSDTQRPGGASAIDPNDPNGIPPIAGSPRLAIERAPSPTEARPLRRIALPEENVNLGKREWDPNRKYWAAAGTCHMILYFQDPVLERYGQGVEQSLGPWGRYFSYPLDDPKQSNQRNQILQPFWSMGKFCFQVGTLPYKLVVDPPWESEYDLGYYRPGDRIPTDTIFITPFGIGPPLKGRNY